MSIQLFCNRVNQAFYCFLFSKLISWRFINYVCTCDSQKQKWNSQIRWFICPLGRDLSPGDSHGKDATVEVDRRHWSAYMRACVRSTFFFTGWTVGVTSVLEVCRPFSYNPREEETVRVSIHQTHQERKGVNRLPCPGKLTWMHHPPPIQARVMKLQYSFLIFFAQVSQFQFALSLFF